MNKIRPSSQKTKVCEQCGKSYWKKFNMTKSRVCGLACATLFKTFTPEKAKEKFWSMVLKGERCWIWQGAKHFRGYGACAKCYVDVRAHRAAWKYTHGEIPNGLYVLHKCDTPLCVNPFHLYLGTQKDNAADCKRRGRQGYTGKPIDQLLHPQLSKKLNWTY